MKETSFSCVAVKTTIVHTLTTFIIDSLAFTFWDVSGIRARAKS